MSADVEAWTQPPAVPSGPPPPTHAFVKGEYGLRACALAGCARGPSDPVHLEVDEEDIPLGESPTGDELAVGSEEEVSLDVDGSVFGVILGRDEDGYVAVIPVENEDTKVGIGWTPLAAIESALDVLEGAEPAVRRATVDGQEAMIDGTVPPAPTLVEKPRLSLAGALKQLADRERIAAEANGTLSRAKEAAKVAGDAVNAALSELREAAEREVQPELYDVAGAEDR